MKIQFFVLALVAALLSACNQDSSIASKPLTVESSALFQEQTHTDKSTHFVGKPHAPVSMQYQLIGSPSLNEELTINLTFSVEQETELLEVKFTSQDGLTLYASQMPYIFPNLLKAAVTTVSIIVKPETAGLRYINVFASLEVNNIMQSRSFAVPVNTNPLQYDELKSAKAKSTTAGLDKGMKYHVEQNVVSMPASESAE